MSARIQHAVRKQREITWYVSDNADTRLSELDSRDAAAAMRAYADEIDARAAALPAPAAREAREWAEWIREHAKHTDSLNGPLCLEEVTSCSHEELKPHMRATGLDQF